MKRNTAQRINGPLPIPLLMNISTENFERLGELARRRIYAELAANGLEIGSMKNRQCFWYQVGDHWIWAATRKGGIA